MINNINIIEEFSCGLDLTCYSKNFVNSIAEPLKKPAIDFVNNTVLPPATKAINSLESTFNNKFETVKTNAVTSFNTIKKDVEDKIPGASIVLDSINSIPNNLRNQYNEIKKPIKNTKDDFIKFLNQIGDRITNEITPIKNRLENEITNRLTDFKNSNVFGTVQEIKDRIFSEVSTQFNNITISVREKIKGFIDKMEDYYNKIKSIAEETINQLISYINKFKGFIKKIYEFGIKVKDNIQEILIKIRDTLYYFYEKTKEIFVKIIQSAKEKFELIVSSIWNNLKEIFRKVVNAIETIFKNIMSALNKIKEYIEENYNEIKNVIMKLAKFSINVKLIFMVYPMIAVYLYFMIFYLLLK